MKTTALLLCVAGGVVGGAARAGAQELNAPGAARVEVGVSPAGGTFFTADPDHDGDFGNYAIGANATYNANRFVGIEGEIGAGIGVKQQITFNAVPFDDLRSPNTTAYNGNVVVYPGGHDRPLVPYLTAGLGAMTIFARDELAAVDLFSTETLFTQNFGGGLKWWSADNWGLRADYRFIIVNGRDNLDPFFGLDRTRFGNRVSASVLYTFGN
jgi:opacity protein-like surface antigen